VFKCLCCAVFRSMCYYQFSYLFSFSFFFFLCTISSIAIANQVAYGGTPAFMAPELFLTNSTIDFTKHEGIDVFALGATLYFMICGRPPWMAKNQIDLATKIKNIELTFPANTIDPHLKVGRLVGW
jgi:hypothetical protein